MAIVRMISRDPAEFREFQGRMVTVGKIRLGVYNGRYPEKIDTFRFTSEDGNRVQAIAGAYGGDAEQWTPQGGTKPQWEVITGMKAIPVLIVNGQDVEPWYEAWGAGRTCIRRCDGVINKIDNTPCLCNGPGRPTDAKKLCKPTIRVQLMLAEAPGFGSWMLESHGENACQEIAPLAPFIATARIAIPAILRLRAETRREWNPDKKGGPGFETKNFFVPWLDTPQLTVKQIMAGGEELTQAIIAAGGSAMIGGSVRQAIAAAPVSAVPAPAPEPAGPAVPTGLTDQVRADILAAIESKTTTAELEATRDKLQARGVDDQRVRQSWRSKYDAIVAAEALAQARGDDMPRVLPFPSAQEMEAAGSTCCGGYRTPEEMWSPCTPCPIMQAREAAEAGEDQWQYEQARASDPDQVELYEQVAQQGRPPTPEEAAWTPPGVDGDMFVAPVEGTVEGAADPLPMVPDGDHDHAELYSVLMNGASRQTPPLTTAELNGLICRTFGVAHPSGATGQQLARLRAGLKAGTVLWR